MKYIILVLIAVVGLAGSQLVSNVRVVDHIDYICELIQKVVSEVERRQWCNLKLLDIVKPINETVIDRQYKGTFRYTNGFVVSIQQVDILQSSVNQQHWNWNNTLHSGNLTLQGTLRLTDLALGYDVIVEVEDGTHRYTAIYIHPLASYTFKVVYSIHDEAIELVTVEGSAPEQRDLLPSLFPKDMTSDVITSLFAPVDVIAGVKNLENFLQPIVEEIIPTIQFPRICYDCPA